MRWIPCTGATQMLALQSLMQGVLSGLTPVAEQQLQVAAAGYVRGVACFLLGGSGWAILLSVCSRFHTR
jgi:hypothetical protein